MKTIDWNLVVAIITALGIFEVIKRLILFGLEHTLIARNLEIREIAQREFNFCIELKLMHFIEPLPPEHEIQLRRDVIILDQFDKKLADKVQNLYTYPHVVKALYENWKHSQDNNYHKEAVKAQNKLETIVLDSLRYKPLITLKK